MFSSKICYLFTVCTRSHDPLSGENLSPHAVDGIGLDIAEELARAGRDEVLTCEVIGLNAHVYPLTRLGIEVGAAGSDLRRRHTVGQVAAVALVPALQPAIVAHFPTPDYPMSGYPMLDFPTPGFPIPAYPTPAARKWYRPYRPFCPLRHGPAPA